MTVGEFAEKAAALRRYYRGSETSGGRTDAHSIMVGGKAGDPHAWDLGRDWIYATGPNRPGSEDHPKLPVHCPTCSTPDLKVIHEPTHDHVQPFDFPPGTVTEYDGVVKDWT